MYIYIHIIYVYSHIVSINTLFQSVYIIYIYMGLYNMYITIGITILPMSSPTWIVHPWPYLRGQFSKGLHCRDDLAAWEDCRISWEIGGLLYEYDVLYTGWWLTYPSEKMIEWKSVGMMTFPTEWNNKIHVPNHQPEKNIYIYIYIVVL